MTSDPTSAVRRAGDQAPALGLGNLPGLRTFRSSRFRVILAATLLCLAVLILGITLARQAADPQGQFAIDFGDYRAASERLAAGASPYAPEMLTGPVDAQGTDRYRYPPLFAQALMPLNALSAGGAATVWLLVQAVAAYAAVWLSTGLRGAPRTLERALWCGVAVACFLPVFDTLWKGNVSAVVALQIALIAGGAALGGAALATATLLKVSPLGLAFLVFGRNRRFAAATAATAGVLVAVSVALTPGAWLDYVRVLPNLFGGDATQATNLSPWAMALTLGVPAGIASLLRDVSLVAAAAVALAAVPVARRPGGWHAAVVLGTLGMLLLPAQIWYHYLVALLPLAALAWMCATSRQRAALFVSGAAVSLGIAWLPLATLGAAGLAVTSLVTLWPRGAGVAPPPSPSSAPAPA